jgi:hypothetical protein
MYRSASALASAGLFSACLFSGSDDSRPVPLVPYHDAALASQIESIKEGLTGIRGMAFNRPLHSAVISPQAFREQLSRQINQGTSDAMDRAFSRQFSQMGLFKDTVTSIRAYWTDFFGSFPAGYYTPGRDSIYILSNYVGDQAFMRLALPHELVHALQDQDRNAFDTARREGPPAYYAGDFKAARDCLIEGDAEFTAHAYFARTHAADPEPFAYARNEALRRNRGFDRWKRTAPALQLFAPAAAPYEVGMLYVADLHASGGFPAIDSQYPLNAQSSLSVLTGVPQAPEAIDLDWLPEILDTADAYVDDYGSGALNHMALFIPWLTQDDFNRGLGWRGDRQFYRLRPTDIWGAMVWVQTFAQPGDASLVFGHLLNVIPARFAGSGYAPRQDAYPGAFDQAYRYDALGLSTVLIRVGREIWWVEGAGEKTDAIIERLKARIPIAVTAPVPVPDSGISKGLIKSAAAAPARKSGLSGPDLDMRFFHSWPRR